MDNTILRAWDDTVQPVLTLTTKLHSSVKIGDKDACIDQSQQLSILMKNLVSCEKPKIQLSTQNSLCIHASKIAGKIAKLILTSWLLLCKWPILEGLETTRYYASQMLVATRTFVAAAQNFHVTPQDARVLDNAWFQKDFIRTLKAEIAIILENCSNELVASVADVVNIISFGDEASLSEKYLDGLYTPLGQLIFLVELLDTLFKSSLQASKNGSLRSHRDQLCNAAKRLFTGPDRIDERCLDGLNSIINITEDLISTINSFVFPYDPSEFSTPRLISLAPLSKDSDELYHFYKTMIHRMNIKQRRVKLYSDKSEKKSYKKGLLMALLKVICTDIDESYMEAFLLSYTVFGSSYDVFDALLQLENNGEFVKKRLVRFFEIWIAEYWSDTDDKDALLEILDHFFPGNRRIAQYLFQFFDVIFSVLFILIIVLDLKIEFRC